MPSADSQPASLPDRRALDVVFSQDWADTEMGYRNNDAGPSTSKDQAETLDELYAAGLLDSLLISGDRVNNLETREFTF